MWQMKERQYIGVTVRFDADGRITPLQVRWTDGRSWQVEKVLFREGFPLAGEQRSGVRFTVEVKGQEKLLFYNRERWYVFPV